VQKVEPQDFASWIPAFAGMTCFLSRLKREAEKCGKHDPVTIISSNWKAEPGMPKSTGSG